MYRWVKSGGAIDRVEERRPEWTHLWHFHFDLRLDLDGRRVYVETRLDDEMPDDPTILMVNVHWA